MAICFVCSCNDKRYYLPDNHAGKRVRCPICKVLIIVPQAPPPGTVTQQGNEPVVLAMPSDDQSIPEIGY